MNLSAVPGFDGAVYLNGFPASKSKKGMVQNQVTNLVLHHPFFVVFLRNEGNVTSWKREEDKRDGGKDNMKTC